jgi:hypothetical protein
MTLTKICGVAIVTASLIIATATTLTSFPGVTPILATPITPGSTEQVGNDTAVTTAVTNTTTITSPTTGQEQQEQPISITKDGTTSYVISGGSSSIGSFDITYIIAGESSAVRASEGLIISTITSDYSSSPTIGYVMIGNNNNTTVPSTGAGDGGAATTLPNPFATAEQITEKITSELRRVIDEADGNNTDNSLTTLQEGGQQQPMMEIKCVFGMEIDDMRCDNYIPSAEGMGEAVDLTPSAPVENGEFETDSNIS